MTMNETRNEVERTDDEGIEEELREIRREERKGFFAKIGEFLHNLFLSWN